MKKLVLAILVCAIYLVGNAQIEMNTYGNVGIGTTPNTTYQLKTNGFVDINCGSYSQSFVFNNSGYMGQIGVQPSSNNYGYIGTSSKAFSAMYSYGFHTVSDSRQKENFNDIENPLNKILNLKGLTYDIKKEYSIKTDTIKDKYKKEKIEKQRYNHMGFLAQDVQAIIPQAVIYDDETDVYSVNYSRIIPVLVEAIKEQQKMIEALESNKDKKDQKSAEIEINSENMLYQNAPNPFTESTTIKYQIAENVQNAMLNIYNMNGTQLKSIAINQIGSGNVTINGSEFGAGMYMYALIADGQIIDTKNMVLTD